MEPINPFENQIHTLNPNLAPAEKRSHAVLITALVVILIAAGAAAYELIYKRDMDATPTMESQIASPDQETASSTESDEALEAELDAVLNSNNDAEMSSVDKEFDQ